MTISKELLDELLKGCARPEDLLGDAGLLKELRIKLMERMLGAELTAHLGYEDGKDAPPGQSNRRNGTASKRLKGQDGEVPISVPRDRDGSFEPELIKKGQTRIDGMDDKSSPWCRHRSEAHGGRSLRGRPDGARHPCPS
jgi:transposase-like protein